MGRKAVYWTLGLVGSLFSIYRAWRHLEIRRLLTLVDSFARDGYVIVKGVKASRKEYVWKNKLSKILLSFWSENHNRDIDINDVQSWPSTDDGRAYSDNYIGSIAGLPRLYSENYEVQAVLCCFFSPRMDNASFGSQTHWKLKLLINPLWALGFSQHHLTYSKSIILHGDDQAWHIVNWPAKGLSSPEPISDGGHVDSGPGGIFTSGIPPTLSPLVSEISPYSETDLAMLSLLAHQCAILFYCETPGVLAAEHGMTGLYRSSHIVFLDAIRRCLQRSSVYTVPWNSLTEPLAGIRYALKKWASTDCALNSLVQPELTEDSVMLCNGFLVHTIMRPTAPMILPSTDGPAPRVIQNAKAYIKHDHSNVLARQAIALRLLKHLDQDSMAWRLVCDPSGVYETLQPKCNDRSRGFSVGIESNIIASMINY